MHVSTTAPSLPFRVEVQPVRDRVIVAPIGEIDIGTVDIVRARLDELDTSGVETVLLDLRGVGFLDTSGLRLILAQARRTDIEFGVIPGDRSVQRVFEISGLVDSLPFVERP